MILTTFFESNSAGNDLHQHKRNNRHKQYHPHLKCNNQKCVDPCPGACGENADCYAYNHRPVCQCRPDYEGDAFKRCTKRAPRDPCEPNPCGANTEHRSVGNKCVYTCLPNHFGDPTVGCKYECVRHEDCSAYEAW